MKGDLGLVLKSKAKHAAIAASLDRPFQFTNKPFIVQYDVTFQNGQECGGAYIKLLTQETGMRLSQFRDKTPYTIMFGPDKCGNDHKVVDSLSSFVLTLWITTCVDFSCISSSDIKIPRMALSQRNMQRNQVVGLMSISKMESLIFILWQFILTTRSKSLSITK